MNTTSPFPPANATAEFDETVEQVRVRFLAKGTGFTPIGIKKLLAPCVVFVRDCIEILDENYQDWHTNYDAVTLQVLLRESGIVSPVIQDFSRKQVQLVVDEIWSHSLEQRQMLWRS